MFRIKSAGSLKFLAAFSLVAMLTACSDDDVAALFFDADVPPANVQVVAGDDDNTDTDVVQNTISWTRDPAASDYVVYWNNTGADIDTSSSSIDVAAGFSNVVHTGLEVQPGAPLYYKVQARTATESSELSAQVTGTPQQSITGNNLNDVAWNATDTLVAVGDSGDIITSPSGLAAGWSAPASGVSASLAGVTWANSQFTIVGAGLTVLTGDGASSWTLQNLDNIVGDADLEDVAWVFDRYIAVGKNGTIITSTTGTVWALQDPGVVLDNITLKGVAGNDDGSKVVAVGTNGTLLTSDDNGDTWAVVALAENNDLNDATWDGDQFVVVGSNDSIWTSSDGVTWAAFNPGTSDISFVGVTQWDSGLPTDPTDRILAAVGSSGDFVVTDTTTALKIETGTNEQLSGITWVDNGVDPAYFVMVGHNGTVLTNQLNQ